MSTKDYQLTRGTKELIKNVVEKSESNNRYVLCEMIADHVETKYNGLNLEYQLKRMGLATTGQILKAIDIYFFKHMNSKS